MNGTNVPEDRTATSNELEALVVRLTGNKAFARCRNTFDWRIGAMVDKLIKESASPSDFCERFDAYFGSVRAMGDLLTQLRRDKKLLAHGELHKALRQEEFVITGETVPLDKTMPITLLMLEPAKTFILLRWMAEAKTAELNRFIGIEGDRGCGQCEIGEATKNLFAAFPTLERHARENAGAGRDNGSELILAYHDEIAGLPGSFLGAMPLTSTGMMRLLRSADRGGSGCTFTFPTAFLFFHKEQGEVLSVLNREMQTRVATWQLNVPEIVVRYANLPKWLNIGFHPESEQSKWRGIIPSCTSKGVAQGHGATFLTYSIADNAIKDYRYGVSGLTGPDHDDMTSSPGCRILMRAAFKSEAQFKASVAVLRKNS